MVLIKNFFILNISLSVHFFKSFEDIANDAGVVLENFFVDNDIHAEDVLGNTNNNE